MRQKFDFVAPAGTHFGVVQTLAEILAGIPNPVDQWDAATGNFTIVDGRVSEWTGAAGRKMVQATASTRPVATDQGLRFFDPGTGLANARMQLSGEQLGAQSALTIAARVRISAGALGTDQQYLWGCNSPVMRQAYRLVGGNNVVRSNILLATANLDTDLPPGVTEIGTVLVCNGPTYTQYAGGQSTMYVGGGSAQLAELFIGAQVSNQTTLAGWYNRFGIWRSVPSPAQLDALLGWVA